MPRRFYDIVVGIARCFVYLHFDVPGEKLIHRDLKPDNVLIADDLAAKVADFGESRRYDSREGKDRFEKHDGVDAVTMTMVGTPLCVFSHRAAVSLYCTFLTPASTLRSGIAPRRYSGATHARILFDLGIGRKKI